ncbi:myc protein [Sabethes cyaneus]|uniref:myc protein n=1 Tax=Sabethes cyaneus TaxID=53552 RepID=UPI00237E6E3B|nr:myc protein [Sabethes cyaneus]XP_053681840.1 myc protein [Sabethes cyaneus]
MILAKKPEPFWDDSVDLEGEIGLDFKLMDFPTLEFLNVEASELEQSYSNGFGWEEQLISSKQQIRNHDCMWSGSCADQSHPGKMGGRMNNNSTNNTDNAQEQSPAVGTGNFNTVTAVAAASLNSNVAATQQKPILTNSSVLNINNNVTQKVAPFKAQTAQIPAGRSLLINPRSKPQQQQISRVPTISTTDFLREREGPLALHTRPDTPLSLDDDPPEFKHNIDLATCTIGSNQFRLTNRCSSRPYAHHGHHNDEASSHRIINMIKEELEDSSDSLHLTRASSEIGSLTDLLNDLEELKEDGQDSETESDVNGSSSWCSGEGGGGGRNGGDLLPGGYTHAHHQEMSPSSSSSSPVSSSAYEYHQGTHVGDHSYTRPKNRYSCSVNELGVDTPSDSEEEIDVVSIGEKNLPTNPTARDRRALQNRVAHKIARKQQQQQQQVSGTQHHRRRHSDDDLANEHHSSGGSSHTSSPSKYATSSYMSPNYLTPASSTTISGTNTPLPGHSSSIGGNSRKRPSKEEHRSGSGKSRHHHQHRNKKQRIPGKKPISDSSEELETLEKRNLHNDMERQRRIGLKNLFEELKRQIPTLREKERAPKVNILREAANLCQRLNREQEQLNALRKQQQRLYARVRQLRTSLHSQRRSME